MRKTIRISVTGKVQGVWYRQSARDKAQALELTGWVRNEPDGSVSVVVTGESEVLASFADWCRTGSPKSKVSGITIQEALLQEFDSFMILR